MERSELSRKCHEILGNEIWGREGGWGRELIIGYSISSWGISCPLLSGWLDPTLTKTYFAINL